MVYIPPKYPADIPTSEDLPDRVDDVDWLYAARYNELKKELRACLIELGTLPKGEYADVKTRLDAGGGELPISPEHGDLVFWNGTAWVSISIGTAGQNLQANYILNTQLQSTFDGPDEAQAYTDPIQGAATFVGSAKLDSAQKKFGDTSLWLDGNSDYVHYPTNAGFNWGTGAFTMDVWVYPAVLGTTRNIAANQYYVIGKNGNWKFDININGLVGFTTYDSQTNKESVQTGNGVITTGKWQHIALVGNGATEVKIYVAGTLEGSGTIIKPLGVDTPLIGIGINNYYQGWIDMFRILKGTAQWAANFTPPTAAYGLVPVWTT